MFSVLSSVPAQLGPLAGMDPILLVVLGLVLVVLVISVVKFLLKLAWRLAIIAAVVVGAGYLLVTFVLPLL